jgi:hypothetical protein
MKPMSKENFKENSTHQPMVEITKQAAENFLTSCLKKRSSYFPSNPRPSLKDMRRIEDQISPIEPIWPQEHDQRLQHFRKLKAQLFKVKDSPEKGGIEFRQVPCILTSQLSEAMFRITQRIAGITLVDEFVLTPDEKINPITLEFKSQVLYSVNFNQGDSKLLLASVKVFKENHPTVCLFVMLQRPPSSPMPKPVILLIKSSPNVLKTIFQSISRLKSEKALVAEVSHLQTSSLHKGAIKIQMVHKSQNFKRGDINIQHSLKVSDFKIQPLTN